MLRLTVEKGEPAGAVFELKSGETTLGRSRAATVHLVSADVSGLHARIRVADGVAQLENLSQFGVSVDGVPVTGSVTLTDGQRLMVGKTTVLLFQAGVDACRPSPGAEAATDDGGGRPSDETRAATAGSVQTTGATRAAAAVTRASPNAEEDSDLTGGLSQPGVTSAAAGSDEDGMTRAMQTRAATPEEIEHLKQNEQKRLKRRTTIGIAVTVPLLILVFVFRPRTPPPETEIEWAQSASGDYLDAYEPAPSGGIKDGGYDLLYPDNKTFKKTDVAGGIVFEGRIGRNLDVPMRVILQEESDSRLVPLSRVALVDDWMEQMSASGGTWNFDKPSPVVNFFGSKNGVPYTRVSYQRDGNGSWFGVASVFRSGYRRMAVRTEVPAVEDVRAAELLSVKMIRVSAEFEYAYWEGVPVVASLSEDEVLSQARADLDRMAPATWVALEGMLSGLLTKAVQAGHKETEAEGLRYLVKLRDREALWFNSQQLAFDAARMQGNNKKALKIAEFTKAVFSNVEDQRYFTVRKWKVEP